MDHARKRIVALIVAYNEEYFISNVVIGLKKYIDTVVVVDDGSTDRTAYLAKLSGAKVLQLKKNLGKGNAILVGFRFILLEYVWADIIALLDGDGQHDPRELPNMIYSFNKKGVDMLIGVRNFDFGIMPVTRIIWNMFISLCVSIKIKNDLLDSQSGYRILRRSFVQNILRKAGQNSYTVETELILIASRIGAKIEEVPVKTIYQIHKLKNNSLLENFVRSFNILKYVVEA